jgi:hypothetical protein
MTASETYKARIKSIEENIKKLQKQLKDHQKEQKLNPNNWGLVGDVAHIDEHLKEIVK